MKFLHKVHIAIDCTLFLICVAMVLPVYWLFEAGRWTARKMHPRISSETVS